MMDDFGSDLNEVAPYSAFASFVRHVVADQDFVDMNAEEYAYWEVAE